MEDLKKGFITFPKSGTVMSLAGMAYIWQPEGRENVGLPMNVASKACVFLLKIVAFEESPHTRKKDLSDLCHIIHHFLSEDDDLRYAGPAADLQHYQERACAYHLGIALGEMLEREDYAMIEAFVARVLADENLAEQLAKRSPPSWNREVPTTRDYFRLVVQGLHHQP